MPPVTLEVIEKALEDLGKKTATKEEVAGLIKEHHTQQEERLKALETTVADIETIKTENADLATQVKALVKSRFASIKGSDNRYNGVFGSHEEAKDFGLYVLGYIAQHAGSKKAFDELGYQVKGMAEGDNADGGALVPTEFIPRLVTLIENYGIYRRLAQEMPMGSDSAVFAAQDSDVTVYCPGEGTQPTASEPGFRNLGLQAKKWMTLTAISSELNEDAAIAVGELVARSIARAFAKKEDDCGFVGDGTSTYFGVTGIRHNLRAVDDTIGNCKGLKVQGTAGAWSAIVLGDLLGTMALLTDDYASSPDVCFVTSRGFYLTVMAALAIAAGGTSYTEVMANGFSRNPTFMGYPVYFTGAMPSVKAAADHCPLLFGDFKRGCALGDRRMLRVDQSREAYFTTDQTGIRGIERIAFNNYGVGDTANAGPVVGFWADIS